MTILEMSLGGGVMIAVILALRRLLACRVPRWTFLLLWGAVLCRLLIPFALPSPLSVYTGAARLAEALRPAEEAPVPVPDLPAAGWEDSPFTAPGTLREDSWAPPEAPAPPGPEPVSPAAAVHLTGAALCGLFFGAAYLWALRRFWDAVPAEGDFLRRWREEHPTLLPVQIKVSRAVNAPLAYGLLRPVILLPEHTDWSDEDQLTYILTHEYVHIRRGDLLWKLLLTAAVCVHWCNPLVWAMYFCANRDLELACDERVVRILGLENRKGYAYSLLAAAESRPFPLCTTYSSKNYMEERIRAVMKMKKRSFAAVLAALLLVAGVTAVFATSKAPEPKELNQLPQAVQTNPAPKPAPGDKSVPEDNRVHPVTPGDTSTPAGDRVHPVTDQPADSAADVPQQSTIPENRWGVPDGEIPQWTEFTVADFDDARELGRYLEAVHGLYPGDYTPGRTNTADGSYYTVQVHYQERQIRERLPDGVYPVNNKGETYGSRFDESVIGYDPDLVAVRATNGVSGYVPINDLRYCGYQGPTKTLEDIKAYDKWQDAQPKPITIPVYDVNHDKVVGYFEFSNGNLDPALTEGKDLETVREEVKNNRWGVPADPIPEGTEFTVPTEDEMNDLCDYLHGVRGIKNGDLTIQGNSDGTFKVCVSYYMTKQEEDTKTNLTNGYPVNSKGETYGNAFDMERLDYEPDLIGVIATNGKSGYMLWNDYEYLGYPGKTDTPEEFIEFIKWQNAQSFPISLPVYDVNRDNIIGYFEVGKGSSSNDIEGMDLETARKEIENNH